MNYTWRLEDSFVYTNCGNCKNHDLNATVFALEVITVSSSALFYLVVVVLSALSVCFKSFVKVISSQATSILLLIGLIMLTINVFNTSANKTIVLYHRIISCVCGWYSLRSAWSDSFFHEPNLSTNPWRTSVFHGIGRDNDHHSPELN